MISWIRFLWTFSWSLRTPSKLKFDWRFEGVGKHAKQLYDMKFHFHLTWIKLNYFVLLIAFSIALFSTSYIVSGTGNKAHLLRTLNCLFAWFPFQLRTFYDLLILHWTLNWQLSFWLLEIYPERISDDNTAKKKRKQHQHHQRFAFHLACLHFPKINKEQKFQMEVEKKLTVNWVVALFVVNLLILCRDYCILLEPINNIITEKAERT